MSTSTLACKRPEALGVSCPAPLGTQGKPTIPVWLLFGLRFLLGTIFVYGAIIKLCHLSKFAETIASFQIVSQVLVNPLALTLSLYEFLSGVLVITGFFLRIGLLSTMVMLSIFSGVLSMDLLRGISTDCGCFGGQSVLDGGPGEALIRDTVLLVIGIFLYRSSLLDAKESSVG